MKTTMERITNLREMLNRKESPSLVMAELHEVMNAIDNENDKNKRKQALDAMLELTVDMMMETPMAKLLSLIDEKISKNKEPIQVGVKINEYIDATLIEIDKKIPYRNLLKIIKKVRKTFDQDVKDLYSARYDADDKHLMIDYKEEKQKCIVIDLSQWNLSDEVAEVYIEGFVEYLAK